MKLTLDTHRPCRVFDADGVELKYVFWAETETGDALHYRLRDGRPYVDTVTRELAVELLRHKAPLTWEPIPNGGE